MKYGSIAAILFLASLTKANPLAVEESFRATPAGATDLVPRTVPLADADRESETYIFTIDISAPPDVTMCYQPERASLFSPAKPIEISFTASELEETEE